MNHRAGIHKPVIVGGRKAGALHAVANLLAPFLGENGYTVDEIKRALNGGDVGLPSPQQLERALIRVRHGAAATNGARSNGRPSAEVLDVNAAWHSEPAETVGAAAW